MWLDPMASHRSSRTLPFTITLSETTITQWSVKLGARPGQLWWRGLLSRGPRFCHLALFSTAAAGERHVSERIEVISRGMIRGNSFHVRLSFESFFCPLVHMWKCCFCCWMKDIRWPCICTALLELCHRGSECDICTDDGWEQGAPLTWVPLAQTLFSPSGGSSVRVWRTMIRWAPSATVSFITTFCLIPLNLMSCFLPVSAALKRHPLKVSF